MHEEVVAVFIPIIMTLVVGVGIYHLLLFKVKRKANAD